MAVSIPLGILITCLVGITLQIFIFSPLSSPNYLKWPPPSSLPPDTHLQRVEKLGEGQLQQPEDVVVDKNGVVYVATRDGWIKRLQKNGKHWENWKMVDPHGVLGITLTKNNDLIVCHVEKGLFKVNEEGVTLIASQFNGSSIYFADDVIEASDGSLYFSVASTKFGLDNWYLDVLEAKPHGQLLKYDPSSNETSLVLDDLAFANGVALSKDEDYLIVCETWRFQCVKYWLKEENRGKTDIFIQNLPGAPDNINLAPDGTFWIALLNFDSRVMKFVHPFNLAKHIIAQFPKLLKYLNPVLRKATVINVASDGTILRKFEDPDGKVMSFVTSAVEFEDHLYIGSLNTNFLGKLPLKV